MNTLTTSTLAAVTSDIRQFVIDNFLFGKQGNLDNEESLLGKGIIDSTGVLELIQFIEDRYGIRVEDEEAVPRNLDGVNNVANYIHNKLNSLHRSE